VIEDVAREPDLNDLGSHDTRMQPVTKRVGANTQHPVRGGADVCDPAHTTSY